MTADNSTSKFTPTDIGLLALRIGFGLLMIIRHGAGKLAKWETARHTFSDPLGVGSQLSMFLAISAEFGASILLILGLLTRPSAFMLFFTMTVAALIVHAGDPLKSREMALLYATVYLTLMIAGPGKLSVDRLLSSFYAKLPRPLRTILRSITLAFIYGSA